MPCLGVLLMMHWWWGWVYSPAWQVLAGIGRICRLCGWHPLPAQAVTARHVHQSVPVCRRLTCKFYPGPACRVRGHLPTSVILKLLAYFLLLLVNQQL